MGMLGIVAITKMPLTVPKRCATITLIAASNDVRLREQMRSLALGTALVVVGSAGLLTVFTSTPADAATPATAAELTTLAQSYLNTRAQAMVVAGGVSVTSAPQNVVPMSATLARAEPAALATLATRRAADHADGVDFVRANVELRDVKISSAASGLSTVRFVDDTRLYYKPVPGAPPYTESLIKRTFQFRAVAGQWQLVATSLNDAAGPVPTTDVSSSPNAAISAAGAPSVLGPTASIVRPRKSAAVVKPAATSSYNYAEMINWEVAHWNNRSGESYAFSDDCTNFLSFDLRASGWAVTTLDMQSDPDPNDSHWYLYYSPPRLPLYYTRSWSVAEDWDIFARNTGRVYALGNVWSTGPSDIIQAKWPGYSTIQHTMMVTKTDSAGGHYMTYHTNDTLNRSLADIINSNPGTTWFADRT